MTTVHEGRRTATAVAAALALLIGLTGCGAAPAAAPTPSGPATGNPVTIENCGQTLTFNKAPERVYVDYYPLVETFVGLGLGERAIGRAGTPSAGERYRSLPKDSGGGADIDTIPVVSDSSVPPPKEQMLALRPDFVVLYGDYSLGVGNPGVATREDLAKVGAQAYLATCPPAVAGEGEFGNSDQKLDDTYRTILDLGRIFRVEEKAQARVAAMKAQIEAVRAKVADRPPVKVLAYYSGFSEEAPVDIAGGGIVTELLTAAGAQNVFGDQQNYPAASYEEVAARPVDAFLILSIDTAPAQRDADFLFDKFPSMPASVNRRFVDVPELYFSPGGWRNTEVVEILARALHPDAFT